MGPDPQPDSYASIEIDAPAPEQATLIARAFASTVGRYFGSPEDSVAQLRTDVSDACARLLAEQRPPALSVLVRRWGGGSCSFEVKARDD